MRKYYRFMLLLILLLLGGCTNTAMTATPGAAVRYFRISGSQSQNYITNQAMQLFCDLVRRETDGTIQITPYFDSALGDEASVLAQCRYGGVDFARVSAASAAEYAPLFTALQMPYQYTSSEHLFRVLDGEVGTYVLKTLSDSDLAGITYFYAGYRCFFSVDTAIVSLEDMYGLRLRVADQGTLAQLVDEWGATAVPLAGDSLAAALRSGAVDGAEDNLPAYVDSGYYRLAPYWVYDRHTYNTDVLVASAESLSYLSEAEQGIIYRCAAEAAQWQRKRWMSAEVRAMMHASRNGCSMALLDGAEANRFRQAAGPVYDTLNAAQKKIIEDVRLLADPS